MKVAFVFLHPFSESMGSVIRVMELSLSLEKYEVEVFILTPFERSFDLSANVHVISMDNVFSRFGFSRGLYRLSRFFYYNKIFPTLFSKRGLRSGKVLSGFLRKVADFLYENGVDIVQVEQDVALPVGVLLKDVTGLPLVVDLHNISSEELVAAGVLERGRDGFLGLQRRTGELLGEADWVVVVSELMEEYVVDNYGLSRACVGVVPPGGRIFVDEAVVERRVKPIKVAYAGLVAYRERVDLFVKSMPFVKDFDDTVRFYITDKGEALKGIKRLAEGLGVCPSFFWFDDYRLVNKFLSTCHVGVLPSSDDLARKMGTPLKLFNYMSVGLPVVANDIGGWTEIIRREGIGLLTSDDPKEFSEVLISVISDSKIMCEYAANGLKLVKNKYNWDNSARMLLGVYEELVGKDEE